MQIINQQLNSDEIVLVQNWIKQTPNIIFYSQKELARFDSDQVLKVIVNGELAAVCILKNILKNVSRTNKFEEIAVLVVADKYQNQGIASQLFATAVRQIKSRNKTIYTTSRHPKVIHLATKLGFEKVKLQQLPLEINLDNFGYILSFGRIKEHFRKLKQFPNQPNFIYLIKK